MTASDLEIAKAARAVRIRVGDVMLRVPNTNEVAAIAAVAGDGVHPPDYMPFSVPWTDTSSDERARNIETWITQRITAISPGSWTFVAGVWRSNRWVGSTNLFASNFAATRAVSTGSWLGVQFQGQGTGKLMRAGLLAYAFENLKCETAQSEVFVDNLASRAVNESAGYVVVGTREVERRGKPAEILQFELSKQQWRESARIEVQVSDPGNFGLAVGATF